VNTLRVFRNIPQPNKIRGQLHRALILITFIIGLCIFIPTLFIEFRQTIQHQNEEMVNYLNAQTYFFESWLTERSSDIHTIANLDFVKGYHYEKAQDFFQDFKDKTDFTDLIFVNKDGIVQFDTVTELTTNGTGVNVQKREYFQIAKKTQQPYITDIFISKVTNQPIVAFASPILNEQQEFNGVVFGTVNVQIINQYLHESRVGFLGHAYIMNQNGMMLTELNVRNNDSSSEQFIVDEHILDFAVNNTANDLHVYKDMNGKWVFAKSKPINQQGNYDYQINEHQLAPYAQEFQELCSSFNDMSTKVRQDTILLKELSITCQLTKLYNRRYLIEQGELVFEKCLEDENACSCIAIDIDFFKKVNDTYGHLIGDEVLKHVANIISNSVRRVDLITRYGGEEFVILSPDTTIESAIKIAERVRENVEANPYTNDHVKINVTVSIGIAQYGRASDVATFYELLDKADQALYMAKESGRNQLRVYDSTKVGTNI